jgi:hypothetical protein
MGFDAEASSRITLSRVRTAVCSTDSGSSVGVTAEFRSVTSMLPPPVVASAAIRGSSSREKNEQAPLGPRMLERDSHERFDELAELDLARHRLRSLDHCPDVQLLNGAHRSSRSAEAGR